MLKHTQEIKTGDRVSNPVRSMEPWKDIPVVIYPERGTGKVWSTNYSLVTEPNKYKLEIRKYDMEPGVLPSKTEMITWTINRQTLKLDYHSFRASISEMEFIGGLQSSQSRKQSVGTCKIAPAPANNQI